MALSGDAKREYQRIYMAERRAIQRMESDMAKMNWERANSRVDSGFQAWDKREALLALAETYADPRMDTSRFGKITPTREGYITLLDIAELRGYAKEWAWHRFKDRFGKCPRFDENGALITRSAAARRR